MLRAVAGPGTVMHRPESARHTRVGRLRESRARHFSAVQRGSGRKSPPAPAWRYRAPTPVSLGPKNSLRSLPGPVAQWSELAAHNRLVGGSSPPGPTTQSRANGDFLALYVLPRFGGHLRISSSPRKRRRYLRPFRASLSLSAKCRFPETETGYEETPFEY